jgi:hypothetical protein
VIRLFDSLLLVTPWFGPIIGAVLGIFTIYAGAALAVALFHPDARTRRHAAALFGQVLRVVFFRRTR